MHFCCCLYLDKFFLLIPGYACKSHANIQKDSQNNKQTHSTNIYLKHTHAKQRKKKKRTKFIEFFDHFFVVVVVAQSNQQKQQRAIDRSISAHIFIIMNMHCYFLFYFAVVCGCCSDIVDQKWARMIFDNMEDKKTNKQKITFGHSILLLEYKIPQHNLRIIRIIRIVSNRCLFLFLVRQCSF